MSTRQNLMKSIAAFQRECPPIVKGTEGYGYQYSSLPEIYKIIMPLLKKHELGFVQPLTESGIKTIVFHVESGEKIESETTIPRGIKLAKMNDYQVLGAAITYFRRYALCSLLGIISEVDTDMAGLQAPVITEKKGSVKSAYTGKELTVSQINNDEVF